MTDQPPVVLLVHGAFAESTSWNGVIGHLDARATAEAREIDVVAVANPLRSLAGDAAYLRDVVASLGRRVLLVGHSYGGMVITAAAADGDVAGLVYVAGFAPDTGESAAQLSASFPGSTLGDALSVYPLADGGTELAIRPEVFRDQFAADVPAEVARLMARTQRPVTQEALDAPLDSAPAWASVPSWVVFGDQDRNIPPAALRAQARRAGARSVREIAGASHAVAVSCPGEVADTILEALDG